uniref:Uncharacterized protein n=1 Tax=Oryza glumipatula TaxID=40148 RepID=A0A0E0AT79_9ORYZ
MEKGDETLAAKKTCLICGAAGAGDDVTAATADGHPAKPYAAVNPTNSDTANADQIEGLRTTIRDLEEKLAAANAMIEDLKRSSSADAMLREELVDLREIFQAEREEQLERNSGLLAGGKVWPERMVWPRLQSEVDAVKESTQGLLNNHSPWTIIITCLNFLLPMPQEIRAKHQKKDMANERPLILLDFMFLKAILPTLNVSPRNPLTLTGATLLRRPLLVAAFYLHHFKFRFSSRNRLAKANTVISFNNKSVAPVADALISFNDFAGSTARQALAAMGHHLSGGIR